jgi:hypothetical protein
MTSSRNAENDLELDAATSLGGRRNIFTSLLGRSPSGVLRVRLRSWLWCCSARRYPPPTTGEARA